MGEEVLGAVLGGGVGGVGGDKCFLFWKDPPLLSIPAYP